jgi:hypothetical protein
MIVLEIACCCAISAGDAASLPALHTILSWHDIIVVPLHVCAHRKHGGVDVSVLVCSPSPSTLDPAAAAGVSVAASVVGLLLLAYCGYFSWYGRWGLPRLQRVSLFAAQSAAWLCRSPSCV